MTNEQNFKKGDKVYMAYNHTINAIVTDVCDEGKYDYYVKEDGAEFTQGCYECDLLDAKSAFLRRLGALLREFDAFFVAHKTDMPVSVYFNDNEDDVPFASIGKEINKGCGVVVTADNIMDFEKE